MRTGAGNDWFDLNIWWNLKILREPLRRARRFEVYRVRLSWTLYPKKLFLGGLDIFRPFTLVSIT